MKEAIFGMGTWEVMLILGLALIFIGPNKLPELAKTLGKGVRSMRQAMSGVQEEFREATRPINPHELRRQLMNSDESSAQPDSVRDKRIHNAQNNTGDVGNADEAPEHEDPSHDYNRDLMSEEATAQTKADPVEEAEATADAEAASAPVGAIASAPPHLRRGVGFGAVVSGDQDSGSSSSEPKGSTKGGVQDMTSSSTALTADDVTRSDTAGDAAPREITAPETTAPKSDEATNS